MHIWSKANENSDLGWFVYVAVNEYMPDIVKIGFTGNVYRRMIELSCEFPARFEVLEKYEFGTKQGARTMEKFLFKELKEHRININREFFFKKCLPQLREVISKIN